MIKKAIVLIVLAIFYAPVLSQTELVTNGNFSDGLNGWTVRGDNVYSVVNGSNNLQMDYTSTTASRISTQISVKYGERYRFSFYRNVTVSGATFTFAINGVESDFISTWLHYPSGTGTYERYLTHWGADGIATIYFENRDSTQVLIDNVSVVCVSNCRNTPTPTSSYPTPTPAPSKTPNPMSTPQLTPPSVRPSQEPNCGIYQCGAVVQNYPQMPALSSPTPIQNGISNVPNTPISVFATIEAGATQTPIVGVDIDIGGVGTGVVTPVNPDGSGNEMSLSTIIDDDNSDLFFRYVKGINEVSFGPFSPIISAMLIIFGFLILFLTLDIVIPLMVIVLSVIRKGLSLLADFLPF